MTLNLKRSNFFLLLSLLAFFLHPLSAQDKIIRIGGTNVEGDVRIIHQDRVDLVFLDNEPVPIEEIQSIELQFGDVLLNKRIYYYNPRLNLDMEKYVLLKLIVDGDTKLYSYAGPNFDFVFSSQGNLIPLQQFKINDNSSSKHDYKLVLRNNLETCIKASEIESLSYKRDALVKLISKFNRCKSGVLEPLSTPEFKPVITSVSLFGGLNHASHSLKTKIPIADAIVDQRDVQSNNITIGAFFQRNLFQTQKLFFELGVSFRLLNFEVNSVDQDFSIDNLSVNEVSIGVGVNYKFLPSKKLSPEITLGTYIWNFRGHGNVYGETSARFPVLASKYSNLFGIGGSFQGLLKYNVRKDLSLFLSSTYLQKTEDDVFTSLVPTKLQEEINDSFMNNFTVTVGITFQNFGQ
tara:strand:+ start:1073 stop:2290 length:1218 start_codon:yes stop_codon:yes gene_type:complete